MRLSSIELGALVLGVARAASPGIIPIFPINNSTSSTPTPTQSTCVAQCSVYYPQLSQVSWVPKEQIVYTEKIVVGTISYVVITSGKAVVETQTITSYNAMPTEYNLYMQTIDEFGTAAVSVPMTNDNGVYYSPLAYPSNYVDYFTDYHWEGVLPTHDKANSPVCETATPTPYNAVLYKHPEYPQPKAATDKVDENDPFGYEFEPVWVPIEDEPDKSWFDIEFPLESAFSLCSSTQRPAPVPTQFSMPKFILNSTTVTTTTQTAGMIPILTSATGWEEQPFKSTTTAQWFTPQIPHFETTADGFGSPTRRPLRPTSTERNDNHIVSSSAEARFESTASGFDRPPEAVQTGNHNTPDNNPGPDQPPYQPPSLPEIIVSIIHNNPDYFPRPSPGRAKPAPVLSADPWVGPTPVFTYIPTVINGQTTSVPAYVFPGSSATATIGQTVLIGGTPTVLAVPAGVFTSVPITVSGVATSSPAYIISGSITATIGQTVVIDGTTTVLSTPTQTDIPGGGRAVATSFTQPQSTAGINNEQSGASKGPWVTLNAALFGISGLMIMWL